jgi:F-type H+-transporting ATPase subunit a
MHLSPDEIVLWDFGFGRLNLTIVTTWAIIVVMGLGAHLMTRNLSSEIRISRWQNLLETVVLGIRDQIREVGLRDAERFLPFIGTLFLFIGVANLCTIFPVYEPPTGSLSTTAALAICVFVAVPGFGIASRGFTGYLKTYLEPTFIMLPFNVISELSRTLALAVRLFGNIMSGSMILAILVSITPLFFPIFMTALGLLTGLVQAYIFGILATVYIAAATRSNYTKSPAHDATAESK